MLILFLTPTAKDCRDNSQLNSLKGNLNTDLEPLDNRELLLAFFLCLWCPRLELLGWCSGGANSSRKFGPFIRSSKFRNFSGIKFVNIIYTNIYEFWSTGSINCIAKERFSNKRWNLEIMSFSCSAFCHLTCKTFGQSYCISEYQQVGFTAWRAFLTTLKGTWFFKCCLTFLLSHFFRQKQKKRIRCYYWVVMIIILPVGC